MTNFLFIHGASHGAWCWDDVIKELHLRGHRAYAIDLPGHGMDQTPRSKVNRSSYISAVSNFIDDNQLKEVTLIGHSLAGAILPEVVQQKSQEINTVIFLAALVLNIDEAPIDLFPPERKVILSTMAAKSEDGTFILDFQSARDRYFSDLPEEAALKAYSKLTPQPYVVYTEASSIDPQMPDKSVKYIICTGDKTLSKEVCLHSCNKLRIQPIELNTGHDPMLSAPRVLIDLIL